MGTVAAVVVTFNRLQKLKNVIDSIAAQTRKPEFLLVVDNASTDETPAYLKTIEIPDVELHIITLPSNMGGAGGFSAGMRKGYELGADFVWIMDDDGYPETQSLERLEQGYVQATEALGPNVPFACSVVKFIDGTISEMNNPVPTWDWGRALVRQQQKNIVMVGSCSFVSVLIPSWVIRLYGLPYKEYFIWYDDAEYTQRITETCPGVQVLDSYIAHDMGVNKGVNFAMIDEKNAWKFKYGVRNEASFKLHHRGIPQFIVFAGTLILQMRQGGVERKLRRTMIRQLIKGIRFNPEIEYPEFVPQSLAQGMISR